MISYDLLAAPGQIGNQMFKYAALKGIAHNKSYEYLIPPSKRYLNNNKVANKAYRRLTKYSYQNHDLFYFFDIKKKYKNKIKFSNFENSVSSSGINFDKKLFEQCPDNVNIYGYFQSYEYFKNIKEEIKEDFSFKNKFIRSAKKIFNITKPDTAIHIRRGDYLTNPNHFFIGEDYYLKALEKFEKNCNFIVFTDDPAWVSKHKLFNSDKFVIANNYTNSLPPLDMLLMSYCESHIIANSTFSWWGAWLSGSNNVYYPKNWYKDSNENISTLLLPEWKSIF